MHNLSPGDSSHFGPGAEVDRPWTAERIRRELVELFQAATPRILSPSTGDYLVSFDAATGLIEWDIVAAAYHCLGRDMTSVDRERRIQVLTWAWVKSHARDQDSADTTLRGICAEKGWEWRSFGRYVSSSIDAMARILERDRLTARRLIELGRKKNA